MCVCTYVCMDVQKAPIMSRRMKWVAFGSSNNDASHRANKRLILYVKILLDPFARMYVLDLCSVSRTGDLRSMYLLA